PTYSSSGRWPPGGRRRSVDSRSEQESGLASAVRWPENPEWPGDRSAGNHPGKLGLPEDRAVSPGNPANRRQPRDSRVDVAELGYPRRQLKRSCVQNLLVLRAAAFL